MAEEDAFKREVSSVMLSLLDLIDREPLINQGALQQFIRDEICALQERTQHKMQMLRSFEQPVVGLVAVAPSKRKTDEVTFASLPHDVVCLIIQWLTPENICKVARTCKSFRRASIDRNMWRKLYHVRKIVLCFALGFYDVLFKRRFGDVHEPEDFRNALLLGKHIFVDDFVRLICVSRNT